MSENTLEQKLSETKWTDEKENDSGFTSEEMQVFNRLTNDIAEMKSSYPFYHPQDELRFYQKEKRQYLTHTRKKLA